MELPAMRRVVLAFLIAWAADVQLPGLVARAEESWQPIARELPPAGIAISAEDRRELERTLSKLDQRVSALTQRQSEPQTKLLFVDVEIFRKAVRGALEHNEFMRPQDLAAARKLLAQASDRLDALERGEAPWARSTGLVARGYVSRIDGSAQPYGLRIPADLRLDSKQGVPLYVWLHGRNDKLTELVFLDERQRQEGSLKPADGIVLHPYGRNCLGWKSAAEIDVFEAIDAVAEQYPIDRDRIVLMGFSMGGAGAWHLGAHYADRWAAVHAGAGFVDVARYTRLAKADYPPWYEQKLWGTYNVPDYARNLFNLPVIAYSGEVDKQKDAADFMAETFAQQGHKLTHLVGPKMGHKYADDSWQEVMALVNAAVKRGRDPDPTQVSLQTRTLRYPKFAWVEALALGEHWQDARVDANINDQGLLSVQTKNVLALRLSPQRTIRSVVIDGQSLEPPLSPILVSRPAADAPWVGGWPQSDGLRKRHGLQGPIDDAFLAPFLVVLPSGTSHPAVDRWVRFELAHFLARWRDVYRGTPRVKRDVDVTPDDARQFHLVLWGDAKSNACIQQIAARLPIRWTDDQLVADSRNFDASLHVPLCIFPNPQVSDRYVVLNSGPTHREAHDRTNSLQNPKLPDWAIINVTVAPDAKSPGPVLAAGFFDEAWQWKSPEGK